MPPSLHHQTHLPTLGDPLHPTIIALHGRGSDERDLLGLAPYFDRRLLWLSPRAPLPLDGGWEWYRLLNIGQPDAATFQRAVSVLQTFIAEATAHYPVDPQRLLLLGFSQGGMMAYTFALQWPEQVTGVIAHSSYIPLNMNLRLATAGLKAKPFLIVHGTHDPVIPVAWGREARETLAQVEAAVDYHEFPIGHQPSDETLRLMNTFVKRLIS